MQHQYGLQQHCTNGAGEKPEYAGMSFFLLRSFISQLARLQKQGEVERRDDAV